MTGRIRSLDAFRGLTVAAMILVNNPGSWDYVYPPLRHAEWHGWTPTDLIFPFFLFIVGVSLVVSFSRRELAGAAPRQLARKAVLRGALIVLVGLLLSGFPHYDLAHLWTPDFDPEGLLSTVPAVATCLLGTFAGERLLADQSPGDRATGLLLLGAALIGAGLLWNAWFPINKGLWTSSYVLFTGGIACQALAACYWAVDVKGRDWWARPAYVFVTNALFAFVLSGLAARGFSHWRVGTPGETVPARQWLFEQVLAPLAGPMNGSLLFALANVTLIFLLTAPLYRRGIFIKL